MLFQPVPTSISVKRMRDADERALVLQAPERLLRRESFRDFFHHKRSQDLAAGRRDFFPDNDKLRIERPDPADEATNVIYYLEQLFHGTVSNTVEAYFDTLTAAGMPGPIGAHSPLRFGTWVGGDRDGNPRVTSDVTRAMLGLQHERALRLLSDEVRQVAAELSQAQVEYAASDVLYLHRLREVLDARLAREGRTALAQACFDFLPERARLDLAGWGDVDIFAHG